MADPTLFHSLTLEGFRAYLQSKTFDFSKKPCLAIFAPNGLGKSSVIDSLEFLFSEHGTLDRLGQRTLNNQAGPSVLVHNGAQPLLKPTHALPLAISINCGAHFIKSRDDVDQIDAVNSAIKYHGSKLQNHHSSINRTARNGRFPVKRTLQFMQYSE